MTDQLPQRRRPPPPGGPRRVVVAGRPRPGLGARRHVDPHVHVLPPVAHAGAGHPAHAAGGRRPHHPRDRGRVPRPRSDHGPAHQPGEGQDQGVGRAVRAPGARPARRNGCARCCTSCTCCSTRATPAAAAPTWPAATSPARRSGWPGACTRPARRPRGDRPARAHAAHRRPAPGPHAAPTASWSPSPSRTARRGTGALIAEGVALITEALRRGQMGEYQVQAAIAAVHDQARRYDDTDWSEILPSTACSNG